MTDLVAYAGLFSTSLAAATILPAQSEALLTALLISGSYSIGLLVLAASMGNILGSCVNWMLGRGVQRFKERKWFPVKAATLEQAQSWYSRYGRWTLLLSWVPFIGDPITVAAGILGEKFMIFLAIVSVAKTTRYIILTAVVLKLI